MNARTLAALMRETDPNRVVMVRLGDRLFAVDFVQIATLPPTAVVEVAADPFGSLPAPPDAPFAAADKAGLFVTA